MSEYDNNMRGGLWKHEQRHDQDMVLKGDCEIDGKTYWVNVFRNKSAHERSPSFDLKFKAKDAPVEKTQQKSDTSETLENDIPF
tara:strand:- start:4131 stop:4382 length:252 start_codon:yes stop_codon:yes gene_type:complete